MPSSYVSEPFLKRSRFGFPFHGVILLLAFRLSPVNDTLAMQEFESRGDLRTVEARPELVKATTVLDMEHEVASGQVLHHEKQMRL